MRTAVGVGSGSYGDRGSVGCETGGVLEEVRQCLDDEQPVDVDERQIVGKINVQDRGPVR